MNQPTCRTLQLSVKELGRSSDFMASNVFWVYGGGVSSSNSYKTLSCQTIVATSCHQRKKFSVRAVAKIDIVSPFSDKAPEEKKLYSAETYAFTLENVDSVLNEVRPYLIADGGNVTVVSIDDGIVCLQLQGACGSCPSSTSTMKMGIERVLKEKFGDAVKDVIDIDKPATSDDVNVTVADVDGHLEMLRPAIESYGGEVEVMSVDCSKGECRVKYTGPTTLANGIEATIKDKFPQIHTITLE